MAVDHREVGHTEVGIADLDFDTADLGSGTVAGTAGLEPGIADIPGSAVDTVDWVVDTAAPHFDWYLDFDPA